MTLRLHYAPDNASLCVRLALEELRLPYHTVLVDRATKGQRDPAYLALNPNGFIPVLETPHGPMFETAAILLWLADTHGDLVAEPGSAMRAHDLQWLFWLSNTLHPALRLIFYPDQYIAGDQRALRRFNKGRIPGLLDIVEAAPTTGWIDADAPSIHACYLGPILRWVQLYGGRPGWLDLSRWPRLSAFAARAEARPAVARAATAEGLGPHPFTDPQPCRPPEGSAL